MNFMKPFQLPTPLDVATKELRLSQLELLQACGAREAAAGRVTVLEARVKRLQATVVAYTEASPDAAP
jgi:hypothetical protein